MTTSPGKEIRSLFAKAVLEHDAARNLSGDGWAAYQRIHADHTDKVRLEERKHLAEYQTRFEVARQRIIDEGGMRDRNLAPRWVGRDRFDSAVIDRQADREVLAAHQASLGHLREQHERSLAELFAKDVGGQSATARMRTDFYRAAERHSEQVRRSGPAR